MRRQPGQARRRRPSHCSSLPKYGGGRKDWARHHTENAYRQDLWRTDRDWSCRCKWRPHAQAIRRRRRNRVVDRRRRDNPRWSAIQRRRCCPSRRTASRTAGARRARKHRVYRAPAPSGALRGNRAAKSRSDRDPSTGRGRQRARRRRSRSSRPCAAMRQGAADPIQSFSAMAFHLVFQTEHQQGTCQRRRVVEPPVQAVVIASNYRIRYACLRTSCRFPDAGNARPWFVSETNRANSVRAVSRNQCGPVNMCRRRNDHRRLQLDSK